LDEFGDGELLPGTSPAAVDTIAVNTNQRDITGQVTDIWHQRIRPWSGK
jgi:hypothetical protein